MKMVTVNFEKLIQNTQSIEPKDPNKKELQSEVVFTLDVDGKRYPEMSAVLRQPAGTDYATEPIEVENPTGSYQAKTWDHNRFRDIVEDYYRGIIGSQGRGIKTGPGSQIEMRNNLFVMPKSYKFEIPD
jgi:hypothetical protein